MQMKIEQFTEIPNEFLETLDDSTFLREMGNEEQAAASQQQAQQVRTNPAPEIKPESFFEPQPQPGLDSPTGQGSTNVKASEIVSGELAIDILDKFIPVIMVMGAAKILGKEVPKKQFSLSASEKSILAPILTKCMDRLNINFENPFMALAVSAGFIYGSKLIEVANDETLKAVEKVKTTASQAHPDPQRNAGPRLSTRKPGETRGRKPKTA